VHHREDRRRESADRAEEFFKRVVVAQRIAPAAGVFIDVMTGGPDVHSRRGAEHNSAHTLGSQALEAVDDTLDHLGTESVSPALVVEGDDANLSEDFCPDGSALGASGPNRGRAASGAHLKMIVLSHWALLLRVDRVLLG
jgi:hypothetical protein